MLTLHRFRNTTCRDTANHMVECTFSVNRMLGVVGHSNTYCIVGLHISGARWIPEGMTMLVLLVSSRKSLCLSW